MGFRSQLGLALIFSMMTNGGCSKQYFYQPLGFTIPKISGTTRQEQERQSGDILRRDDKDLVDSLNDPNLTKVTREYGFTVVKARTFPFRSPMVRATTMPWSSWWFPKRETHFFDDSKARSEKDYDNLSTLSKFDLVKRHKNPSARSSAAREQSLYKSDTQLWEGLCDAWSIASLSFPEPQRPVTLSVGPEEADKVTFTVGELKGLLLKTLEAVDASNFKYYGQKFTGQESSWIHPDIFPEQFHRFLEVHLFDQRKAFIMDVDPGIEIWNFPVYKANFLMTEIPNKTNAVFVRTWIYLVDSLKNYDQTFIGSKEVIREYDYVLEGERNTEGDLVVKLGYWVKGATGIDSRHDHPDFLMVPPEPQALQRKSWNTEIDVETVDAILLQSF